MGKSHSAFEGLDLFPFAQYVSHTSLFIRTA